MKNEDGKMEQDDLAGLERAASGVQTTSKCLEAETGAQKEHAEKTAKAQREDAADAGIITPLTDGYAVVTGEIRTLTERLNREGRRLAMWGASHQGFTLASTSALGESLAYIIDSAPFKQGRFAPASHVPIVAPDHYFEEPVDADDYDGYSKVAAKCNIPIAGGENEVTRFGFRDLLKTQAISILNPDAACLGGVTEFMKVAAMADANGIVMSPHGQQQIHVHLDCAVPNVNFAEFYPPQYDAKVYEAFKNPVIFNADGTVSPSEAPGVGLDINREALADFRIK